MYTIFKKYLNPFSKLIFAICLIRLLSLEENKLAQILEILVTITTIISGLKTLLSLDITNDIENDEY